jgi:hypothetical protein
MSIVMKIGEMLTGVAVDDNYSETELVITPDPEPPPEASPDGSPPTEAAGAAGVQEHHDDEHHEDEGDDQHHGDEDDNDEVKDTFDARKPETAEARDQYRLAGAPEDKRDSRLFAHDDPNAR